LIQGGIIVIGRTVTVVVDAVTDFTGIRANPRIGIVAVAVATWEPIAVGIEVVGFAITVEVSRRATYGSSRVNVDVGVVAIAATVCVANRLEIVLGVMSALLSSQSSLLAT
jgi:hypothetical protein